MKITSLVKLIRGNDRYISYEHNKLISLKRYQHTREYISFAGCIPQRRPISSSNARKLACKTMTIMRCSHPHHILRIYLVYCMGTECSCMGIECSVKLRCDKNAQSFILKSTGVNFNFESNVAFSNPITTFS